MRVLVFVFIVFLVSASIFINAEVSRVNIVKMGVLEENESVTYIFELKKKESGKNIVEFPFDIERDAMGLLEEVREIDAITSIEENVGYVRAFGGIGKNFRVIANKSYEISVTENVNYSIKKLTQNLNLTGN